MTEQVQVHDMATCPVCKGRVKGHMRLRKTIYDGAGSVDRTYLCDRCGHRVEQNEHDPRHGHPEVGQYRAP